MLTDSVFLSSSSTSSLSLVTIFCTVPINLLRSNDPSCNPLPIPCTKSLNTPDCIMVDTASIGLDEFGSTLLSILSIISVKKFASPSTFCDSSFCCCKICFAFPVGSKITEIINKCCQIIFCVSF